MPDRLVGDPSPRTLDSLYREVKAVEDKFNLRFSASDQAVELLQDRADRQPTTEAVNHDLDALKELTDTQIQGLKELVKAMFEGNKTALDAALKTQKEASDEIKVAFGKQFDNLSKMIDDLKDRINRNDGRGLGRNDFIGWIVAAVVVAGSVIAMLATRT